MLQSFRNASKSKVGTIVIALIGVFILIGFAVGDMQSLGLSGGSLNSSTLAKTGSLEVTDRDMQRAMERQLTQLRTQNPEATYASLAGDFDPLLQSLIDQRTLQAFAKKYGFAISKRLIDAEIANIPGTKGLNGQFSDASYQAFLAQQRLTDAEVRDVIQGAILQRMLLLPGANNPRVPLGMATPYASMLLETREADVALVPLSAFAAGLNPTDAQLQQFYGLNRNRYMVPEQRVLRIARLGPEQVANVAASDAEIAKYYQDNQALYGPKDIRVISQAVVPDRNVANQIAARAKGGQSFVDAVKPAGLSAADVSVGPQTRAEFTEVAGQAVANAAFAAQSGAIVGPIQSDLGWHVVKIDGVQNQPGKSLAQARAEIAEKLNTEKRANALADLEAKLQEAIDGGSNFDEAARAAGLQVSTTPLITASGQQRGNAAFKLPPELAPALKSGFELATNDPPVVEQLGESGGVALVSPAQIIPAAPAPLATIRDRVRQDWIAQQAAERARSTANAIAARASAATPLAEAMKASPVSLAAPRHIGARRLQLSQMGDQVPPPVRLMFTLGQGKSRVAADPQGRGYYVVKVTKLTPGNALTQPGLISQVQQEFRQPLAQEYAQQFVTAVRKQLKVQRNEEAIAATRKQLIEGGS
jgi:peptidyl-prolyl cis-trans isomerase D